MRTLILCLSISLGLWTPAALADDRPDDRGIAHNRTFLNAFLTRCMPAAHTRSPVDPSGMIELPDELATQWLQGEQGTVWKFDAEHDVLLASDRPDHCFVVSKYSDVEDLRDQVAFWFDEDATGFTQDAFETKPSGEFRASYSLDQKDGWRRRILIQARPVPESGGIAIMGTAGFVLGG